MLMIRTYAVKGQVPCSCKYVPDSEYLHDVRLTRQQASSLTCR